MTVDSGNTLGTLLAMLQSAALEHLQRNLAAAGYADLRVAHMAVFRHIDAERGSRLSGLADSAGITKQSMGYLVDYLEEQGYIERLPDPTDGRSKLIRLTAKGKAVYTMMRLSDGETAQAWSDLLGENKMKKLRQLLDELAELLGKAE
ncbi:MAG: MarR family transcriptional regulator [Chloroflexota bacterium]